MKCRECGYDKAEDAFAWRQTNVKRHNICRECQRVKQQAWYAKNRASHIANAAVFVRESRVRQRKIIADAKLAPCADCHRRYPPYVMQFDHLGEKNFTISTAVGRYSDEKLIAEIALCDIVCANCHAERTHSRI